jgi:hypothetical protein
MTHIRDGDIIYPDELYANRDDGVWIWYTCRDSIAGAPLIWAKYPAAVLDTYTSGKHPESNVTVVSTDTVVSTPSGTYSCYCYRWIPTMVICWPPVTYYYLAPDTGPVKSEFYVPDEVGGLYLHSVWELNSIEN